MLNQIAIPKTLEDFIEARSRAITLYKQAVQLLDKCKNELDQAASYVYPAGNISTISMERFIKDVDRGLWRSAFDKTGFMQIMDAQARREFEDSLVKTPPDFTEGNIRSIFIDLFQGSEMLFKRGIVNVFHGLGNEYVTNRKEPFRVGRKVIMSYMTSTWGGYLSISTGYAKAREKINDIDRVIKVLDGKQHHPRWLESAVNAAFKVGEVYEDEYYQIKGFKNGNMHLIFKRQDLLDKANELISEYYNGSVVADARAA